MIEEQNDGDPETRTFNIDFGTVSMSGNEDLHTKLSMSAFSLLFNSVEQIAALPDGCSLLQETSGSAVVTLSVTLKPIGSNVSIMPRPAQDIILKFQGFDQSSDDTEDPTYQYSLNFGVGRGGQTRGEFYFLNVPEGLYTLNFAITVDTETLANCGRRRLQTSDPPFGFASAQIGSYVVAVEKIDVLRSGQCVSLASTNIVLDP